MQVLQSFVSGRWIEGGGEELGGRRALSFYLQRVALEGSRPLIAGLTKGSSS